MSRVLVIDDEADLRDVLEYNLAQAGHQVVTAATAREGIRLVHDARPDLVLLDLMLPDMPGTEVCRTLKGDASTRSIPIVMVTAKGEEIDRIVGFELGADDYVVKPFSVREILLRIQVILRRGEPEDLRVVEFGRLRIDHDAHRVMLDGEEIALTMLEYKLLTTLLERKNRVQSRGVLLNDVWGIESDVTSRTVDTHVKRLREKLGPAGEYIETVRGIGYRFTDSPGAET